MIKESYKIPFTYTPQKAYFKTNKSALWSSDFVTDSIKDLLANKLKKETNITRVISPLLAPENSAGKKRLIIDLRYVNKHMIVKKHLMIANVFKKFLMQASNVYLNLILEVVIISDINETFQLISYSRGNLW